MYTWEYTGIVWLRVIHWSSIKISSIYESPLQSMNSVYCRLSHICWICFTLLLSSYYYHLIRMFNIRRLLPTVSLFERSLSRLVPISTVLPTRCTVLHQIVTRPISVSTTVFKKKEIIDREEKDEDDDGLPQDYKKKTIKVLKRWDIFNLCDNESI